MTILTSMIFFFFKTKKRGAPKDSSILNQKNTNYLIFTNCIGCSLTVAPTISTK